MATELKYQRIIKAIRSTPWAIQPERLADIMDVIAFQANGGKLSAAEVGEYIGTEPKAARGDVLAGGGGGSIAVIRLRGIVAHHIEQVNDISGPGGTSVEGFRARFREAMASPDIGAVVFDIDSPGGAVDGVQELAAEIRAARGEKPIIAFANTLAASAAYWIATAADEISMTPSGDVGSIGVWAAHSDISARLESEGETVTLVHAGKYKIEGHPFGPLDDVAREALQSRVDEVFDQFVADVATGRGASMADVRKGYGEGRVLGASDALANGMVDHVETFDDMIARIQPRAPSQSRRATSWPTSPAAFQFYRPSAT